MNYWNMMSTPWFAGFSFWMLLILAWSLVWKGLALWRAAQKGEKVWFVALLVINTVGILEILYLYVFSKGKLSGLMGSKTPTQTPPPAMPPANPPANPPAEQK